MIRTFTADCPACNASGRTQTNETRDPATGTWDYNERLCVPCDGSGLLPAMEHYETFTLPSNGRVHFRCLWCQCTVNPLTHLPGTEDCDSARAERTWSRTDAEAS